MSGLLFLTSEDFNVQRGSKGDILCHQIPGFSLILFYSTHCEHCHALIPMFKKMPGTIGGCQFGMVNVGSNRKCVEDSQKTIAPITYVPYIVLYINGKPFMVYKGPYDEGEIRRFIIDVANNVQKKQKFMGSQQEMSHQQHMGQKQVQNQQQKKPSIPEYCTGIPVCDGDVCYLDFSNAYNK